jgi:hypothetical protein
MGIILKKPEAIYVSPKQLRRQQKDKITVRETSAHPPDPASALAKAWGIGKLA